MMNSMFEKMKLTKLRIEELIQPEAFSNSGAALSASSSPVANDFQENGTGHATQGGENRTEGKTIADTKETAPCSPNEEILNRLGLVAVRAGQYAGQLKDFSPEQNKIAGLLDQAHEILEPLDTVKLAGIIGALMAALSQKPEGLKSSAPGQQLLMTGT